MKKRDMTFFALASILLWVVTYLYNKGVVSSAFNAKPFSTPSELTESFGHLSFPTILFVLQTKVSGGIEHITDLVTGLKLTKQASAKQAQPSRETLTNVTMMMELQLHVTGQILEPSVMRSLDANKIYTMTIHL